MSSKLARTINYTDKLLSDILKKLNDTKYLSSLAKDNLSERYNVLKELSEFMDDKISEIDLNLIKLQKEEIDIITEEDSNSLWHWLENPNNFIYYENDEEYIILFGKTRSDDYVVYNYHLDKNGSYRGGSIYPFPEEFYWMFGRRENKTKLHYYTTNFDFSTISLFYYNDNTFRDVMKELKELAKTNKTFYNRNEYYKIRERFGSVIKLKSHTQLCNKEE